MCIRDRIQTGDQGYGISALDVVIHFYSDVSNAEFDADEIDWTALTEISVPVAPTMETNWTKALDFSGGNEHAKQVSSRGGELFCKNLEQRVLIAGDAKLYMKGELKIN